MALADRAELAVRLTLDDRAFTGGLRRSQGVLGKFGASAGRVGRGVGQLGTGLARAGTIIAGATVAGFALAAKAAIDYEDAFAGVRKTVEATEPQLATLSDQFRELARTIPIPATEFARLGEIAGALGIPIDQIDEFAEVTAKLGVTTNLSADQAADALGRIANILNITGADFDNFGSALVLLGNRGASTEDEIIDITRRFGAAGKKFGLLTPEILGLAEATASFTGLQPQAAGSSLVRLLEGLTQVVAKGGSDFKSLNKLVGTDFKQAMEDDASDALTLFLTKLSTLDKFEQIAFLKELGISGVYLSQLLGGLTANVDDLGQSFKNADEGWEGNFLNEEAAKKFDTLAQQIKVLKNNIFDAGITIGTEMLPALKRATDRLITFLQQPGNQEFLKSIGRDVGEAIDKIDWDAVARGAKSFVGFMKTALDWTLKIVQAIDMLPGSIKAAGAGFLALNKLSGGLIGAGAGNIFGGAASGLLSKLPGRAAGLGKLFAQPVFVTNWPLGFGGGVGGGPGILGKAAGGLGAALGGGAVLGAAALAASGAALVAALAAVQKFVNEPGQQREAGENISDVQRVIATGDPAQIKAALDGVRASVDSLGGLDRILYDLNANGVKLHTESLIAALEAALRVPQNTGLSPDDRQERNDAAARAARQQAKLDALNVGQALMKAALAAKLDQTRAAQIAAGHSDTARMISAIHAARPIVSVVVNAATNYSTVVKTGQTTVAAGGKFGNKQVPL